MPVLCSPMTNTWRDVDAFAVVAATYARRRPGLNINHDINEPLRMLQQNRRGGRRAGSIFNDPLHRARRLSVLLKVITYQRR